jgi:hypothetical protein
MSGGAWSREATARWQLTRDDHQLVDRHDPPPPIGRGHLSQEQRHRRRGGTDSETEDDARKDHRHERERGGAAERSE